MPITSNQARRFYDRFGSRQDNQGRYEDRALDAVVEAAEFHSAQRVFELGFGTGRLAQRLFERELRSNATYVGQDVSTTMLALARARLAPWSDRVTLRLADGLAIPEPDASFDRFLSTYVLDLMPEPDIVTALSHAKRLVAPGGLLALVGLSHGDRVFSRIVARTWSTIAHLVPMLVGGCRPIELTRFVGPPAWTIETNRIVTAFGVPSQILVARRNQADAE